jgi:polysaccharide pyruvyl transferase WcaK-like protein
LGKPVYLSGQTMGPYTGWIAQQYTRFALNTVKMISFRDKDVSHNRLAEIGVTNPVQFDAADDAISLKGIDDATAVALLEKETGKSLQELKEKMLVVVNMKASLSIFKGQGRSGDLGNEVALMAKIADAMIEKYDCTVILMPTDFSGDVDDRVPHAQIYEQAKHKNSIYQVTDQYIDDELIGMIGLADMALGARYHFNVFAASRYIPFLGIASGIYQRTKLNGLASLCGLKECYVDHDMEFATLRDVWPSVEKVVEERDRIQTDLRERVPGLKERSKGVADAAVEYLTSNTN